MGTLLSKMRIMESTTVRTGKRLLLLQPTHIPQLFNVVEEMSALNISHINTITVRFHPLHITIL